MKMAFIYQDKELLKVYLDQKLVELKQSKEYKSQPKDVRRELSEVAIFLDPVEDSVKPHVQLTWINKFRGIDKEYIEQFRKENGPKLEEKLKQINLLKAIEARKSKNNATNSTKNDVQPPKAVVKPKVSKPIVIIDVPTTSKTRKVKDPKTKKAKLGQQQNFDPFANVPKTAEKPPTPKKVVEALKKKSMNANFKIPRKNLNKNNVLDDEELNEDLDNVNIVDPLASILPNLQVPPKLNRHNDADEGWGNETPRSPRRPGCESPAHSSPFRDGDGLNDGDNPFDNDDYYEGEADYNDYDAVLESTARDLPDKEFDINAATSRNPKNVSNVSTPSATTTSVSKPSMPTIVPVPSKPRIGGRGKGWTTEVAEPEVAPKVKEVVENVADNVDEDVNFDDDSNFDTGFDVHSDGDDNLDGNHDKDGVKDKEKEEEVIIQESTSGQSSSSSRKETHYSSLGHDDDLDFEDSDDDDEDGNFKRRKKPESPVKTRPTFGNRTGQSINNVNNNVRTAPDPVFKRPFDPPKNIRPLVARNVDIDEDPEAEVKRAQRAARFNGPGTAPAVPKPGPMSRKVVTIPKSTTEPMADPFSRRSTRPMAVSTSNSTSKSSAGADKPTPTTATTTTSLPSVVVPPIVSNVSKPGPKSWKQGTVNPTVPSTIPFRPDQVAAFSNDLLAEDGVSGLDNDLFDTPVKKDGNKSEELDIFSSPASPPSVPTICDLRLAQPVPSSDPRRPVADPRTAGTLVNNDPRRMAPNDPRQQQQLTPQQPSTPFDPRCPSSTPSPPHLAVTRKVIDPYKLVILTTLPDEDDEQDYFNECEMPETNFEELEADPWPTDPDYGCVHHVCVEIPPDNESGEAILDPRLFSADQLEDKRIKDDAFDGLFVTEKVQEPEEVVDQRGQEVDVNGHQESEKSLDQLENILAEAENVIPVSRAGPASWKVSKGSSLGQKRKGSPIEAVPAKVVKKKAVITNPGVLAIIARWKSKKNAVKNGIKSGNNKKKMSITDKIKKLASEPEKMEPEDQLLNQPLRGEGDIGKGKVSMKGLKRTVNNDQDNHVHVNGTELKKKKKIVRVIRKVKKINGKKVNVNGNDGHDDDNCGSDGHGSGSSSKNSSPDSAIESDPDHGQTNGNVSNVAIGNIDDVSKVVQASDDDDDEYEQLMALNRDDRETLDIVNKVVTTISSQETEDGDIELTF